MRKLNAKQKQKIKDWAKQGVTVLGDEHYDVLDSFGCYENLWSDADRFMDDFIRDNKLNDRGW